MHAPSGEVRWLDRMTVVAAPPHRGWTRRNLAWVLFLLMLAIFTIGRLVGPRIPDDQQKQWCVLNVHITTLLGVSLNCDAALYMSVAARPSALLDPGNALQSRPGLPIAAWVVALPLRPLASLVPRLVHRPERSDIDPGRVQGALQSFGPEYVAYVLLNLLMLCASFHLFRRIHQAHQPTDQPDAVAIVAAAIATLMVATYPVTNYLLSPQAQLFNTLVPLLALFFAIRANAGALMDVRFAAMVGVIVGFGQTAYALFLVITMAVLALAGVHALRNWHRISRLLLARNAAVLVAISVAPMLLWYAFVRIATHQFFYHELVDDESVVWLMAYLQKGGDIFLAELSRRAGSQLNGLNSLAPMVTLAAALTAGFLIAAIIRFGYDKVAAPLGTRSTVAVAVVVSAMFHGFYVGVGQFQVRLNYAALPPIVAALGAVGTALAGRLPAVWRRAFAAACAALAVVTVALAIAEGERVPGHWFD